MPDEDNLDPVDAYLKDFDVRREHQAREREDRQRRADAFHQRFEHALVSKWHPYLQSVQAKLRARQCQAEVEDFTSDNEPGRKLSLAINREVKDEVQNHVLLVSANASSQAVHIHEFNGNKRARPPYENTIEALSGGEFERAVASFLRRVLG